LPLAFSGPLEETSQARSQVIGRIGACARRQRGRAEAVQGLAGQRDATGLEAGARGTAKEAADNKAELQQRVFFATKTFQDADRTVRYMCEVPVRLEARLGAYARALQAGLPQPP